MAALAGVSVPTLKIHQRAGAPMPKKGTDPQRWLPEYHEWRARHRRQPGPEGAPADAEMQSHRRELAKLRAIREKIALGKEQDQLLLRQDVIDFASEAVLAVNNRLDAMIQRLGGVLGSVCQGGSAHVVQAVAAEVEDIRAVFAQGMRRTYERDGREAADGTEDHAELDSGAAPNGQPMGGPAPNA